MSRARICPVATCGAITNGGRCSKHKIDYGYTSQHWRTTRLARLLHDGFQCQLGHKGCTVRATTVHLAPELAGDHRRATLDTTISACAHCHGVEDAPRANVSHTGGSVFPQGKGPDSPARHLAVSTGSEPRRGTLA